MRRTWGPTPKYPSVLCYPRDTVTDTVVIAGPCSVECEEQANKVIDVLASCGVTYARGGVYRAGTYPRPKGFPFGLQDRLMKTWSKACRKAGLKVIMEVLDVRQVEQIDQYADAFQVGARHMQDYALLTELSKSRKVVTLKRAVGATLDEFLGAAEYLTKGKSKPMLIERGSATHMNHVRWDLSISLIAAVKRMTGLPILVDASHGTGRRDLVAPMTMAGMAAGADGFLVEVHPDPDESLSDSDQALPLHALPSLVARAGAVKFSAGGLLF